MDRRRVSPGEAGFTLIELLIALTILALAMGVAGASLMRSGTGFQVRATSGEVVDLLREARMDAMMTGHDVAVGFNGDARQFAGARGHRIALPDGIQATVASASTAGRGRIIFYQNGTSTGGTVEVFNANRREVLKVDWLTGAVTREEAGQ